ncbi:MAG: TIGR03915 family putative DNA repair protein, partial [Eubacterium sp.]
MKKETPINIVPDTFEQYFLFPVKVIKTETKKAERVFASFRPKMSSEVTNHLKIGFLSCNQNKEMTLYRFIRKGYRVGERILDFLADEDVNALDKIVKYVINEADLIKEFIRFSEYNKTLVAMIDPKNWVLPLLTDHFCDRYNGETFMIYDKTHRSALVYAPFEWKIIPVDQLELPRTDDEERAFRTLWRCFYKTIGIESRKNAKCQMTHMPKRYWSNMVEHQE